MKHSWKLVLMLALLAACGTDSEEEENKELKEMKEQLASKRAELKTLEGEITGLVDRIVELDPDFESYERTAKLVTTLAVDQGDFAHYVQVRGNVASRTNVMLSAEMMGTVREVKVTEGQYVKQGQALLMIDAPALRQSVLEIEKNLELATTLYEKQKALWEQNIGTEVQYLQAKTNMESLQRRLASTEAQYAMSTVKAPFSGRIDRVIVNLGQQVAPGSPVVQLVGNDKMYIQADLSESYIGKFDAGDAAWLSFPSLNLETESKISAVGDVINPLNRTFTVEIGLPNDRAMLKPNMLAVVKVKDYANEQAISVPTKLIQNDSRGDFVFVATQDAEGNRIAKKMRVERGLNYQGTTEILKGLDGSEMLINDGFREVTDGAFIKMASVDTEE